MCIHSIYTLELIYIYALLRVAKRCLLDSVCIVYCNRPRCDGLAFWLYTCVCIGDPAVSFGWVGKLFEIIGERVSNH